MHSGERTMCMRIVLITILYIRSAQIKYFNLNMQKAPPLVKKTWSR